MLSKNEWDPLKSVIVGVADDATIPTLDVSLRVVNYADKKMRKIYHKVFILNRSSTKPTKTWKHFAIF